MEPTHVRLTIPTRLIPPRSWVRPKGCFRRIEDAFDAMITVRGNQVSVTGSVEVVDQVTSVFSRLIRLVEAWEAPSTDDVDLLVDQVVHGAGRLDVLSEDVLLTYRGRTIRPKTSGQKRYIDSMRANTITFGIGPAGTGKTYLAMAMACGRAQATRGGTHRARASRRGGGESLGFLPGTLQEKLDPYVRPLYDALFDMTDMEKGNALIEAGRHRDRPARLHARSHTSTTPS